MVYIESITSVLNEKSKQSLGGGGKGNLIGVVAMLSHKPGNRDPSDPLHCIPSN